MQAKPPRGWARFDDWAVAACALVLATIPLAIHAHKYPDFASFWTGIDQQRYLTAARAWSRLDLSPDQHHYLPLYPLLGAAFLWLTPWQPFLAPDLLCTVASLLIFVRIGRRLAPGWPGSVLAACFLLASMGGRVLVAIWVVPWSTTGSAPCQFLALLLTLRFGERPSAWRAMALGAVLALTAGFRPSDAGVLTLCCGIFALRALWQARHPARAWLGIAVAGLLGLCAGLMPTAAAHLAIFGLNQGAYLHKAASTGLEWRLLPLRWVILVADPRPLLPEGRGMAEILPWVLPGIAGALLALTRRSRIAPAALTGSVVALHWATYLAYRDLQPYGLWRFYNVHYFKWTFPFFVLWSAQLFAALATSGRRIRAAVALAIATLSLCWRPSATRITQFPITQTATTLGLPTGFGSLNQLLWLPVQGDWTTLYFGKSSLQTPDGPLASTFDFKILPVSTGALLMPLRPFTAPARLTLPSDVHLQSGQPGWVAEIHLGFGLPCGISRVCLATEPKERMQPPPAVPVRASDIPIVPPDRTPVP